MDSVLKKKESSAIRAHINMMQGIINRMEINCSNCKTWAITILSAMLVLFANDKVHTDMLWICYIPICLFFFLDCYYLGAERRLIREQILFITKVNNHENFEKDIFEFEHINSNSSKTIYYSIKSLYTQAYDTIFAIFSFSTFPLYGSMILIIVLID